MVNLGLLHLKLVHHLGYVHPVELGFVVLEKDFSV